MLGRKVSDECTVSFIATVAEEAWWQKLGLDPSNGTGRITDNERLGKTPGRREAACCYYSISVIASKTRQELASTLILALVPFHDQALVLTSLNVVWVGR